MRKKIAAVLLAGAFALSIPATAGADPDFGPGNSSKGRTTVARSATRRARTVDEPGCK